MLMELSSSTGQARQDPQPSCPARSTWPTGQQGDGRGPLDRIPCANLRGLSPCLCVGRPCPRSPAQAPPQSLLGPHVATSPHVLCVLLASRQGSWAKPQDMLSVQSPCGNQRDSTPHLYAGHLARAPPPCLLMLVGHHVVTSSHFAEKPSWTLLACSQRNWAIPRGTLALRPLETEQQLGRECAPFLGLELTVGC